MSKIGKKPIIITSGVTVELKDGAVQVQGKNGTLSVPLLPYCAIEIQEKEGGKEIHVAITDMSRQALPSRQACLPSRQACLPSRQARANWGTMAALLKNAIAGAHENFQKKLQLEGIGYRAALEGTDLSLALGFSHRVLYPAPHGITFTVEKNIITISGPSKELVGKVAAEIRKLKKPEPYQGKGIRYVGEVVRRKAGKKAAAATAAKV